MVGKGKGSSTSGSGSNRSAATGRYVTERYAKTHPKTTVTEKPSVGGKSEGSGTAKK